MNYNDVSACIHKPIELRDPEGQPRRVICGNCDAELQLCPKCWNRWDQWRDHCTCRGVGYVPIAPHSPYQPVESPAAPPVVSTGPETPQASQQAKNAKNRVCACREPSVTQCEACDKFFCGDCGQVGGDRQVQDVGSVAYPSVCNECNRPPWEKRP